MNAVSAAGLELCPALGIAVPVGKDSLSMRTQWRVDGEQRTVVSPVTLIVSAFAPVTDARRSLTPDIKHDDSVLILADPSGGRRRLGASSLAQCFAQLGDEAPDVDDAGLLKSLFESIHPPQGVAACVGSSNVKSLDVWNPCPNAPMGPPS